MKFNSLNYMINHTLITILYKLLGWVWRSHSSLARLCCFLPKIASSTIGEWCQSNSILRPRFIPTTVVYGSKSLVSFGVNSLHHLYCSIKKRSFGPYTTVAAMKLSLRIEMLVIMVELAFLVWKQYKPNQNVPLVR